MIDVLRDVLETATASAAIVATVSSAVVVAGSTVGSTTSIGGSESGLVRLADLFEAHNGRLLLVGHIAQEVLLESETSLTSAVLGGQSVLIVDVAFCLLVIVLAHRPLFSGGGMLVVQGFEVDEGLVVTELAHRAVAFVGVSGGGGGDSSERDNSES